MERKVIYITQRAGQPLRGDHDLKISHVIFGSIFGVIMLFGLVWAVSIGCMLMGGSVQVCGL